MTPRQALCGLCLITAVAFLCARATRPVIASDWPAEVVIPDEGPPSTQQGPETGSPPAGNDARVSACSGDLLSLPESLRDLCPKLEGAVLSGPFYGILKRLLGPPSRCTRDAKGGGLHLTYTFSNGGAVEARVDPRLELNEIRMILPGLDPDEAKSLLKEAEQHSYGSEGCGIDWLKPTRERSQDDPTTYSEVFWGSSCNCQGRILYHGLVIEALLLRSTC